MLIPPNRSEEENIGLGKGTCFTIFTAHKFLRVQRKLVDFGKVRGLVFGAFGEASEGVHELALFGPP